MALATLVRPITIVFAPFLLILNALKKQPLKPTIYATLIVLAFWSPWLYWSNNQADSNPSNMKAVVNYGSYPDFTHKTLYGYPNREDPQLLANQKDWPTLYSSIAEKFIDQPLKYLNWYLLGKPTTLWQFNLVQGVGAYIYPVNSSVYNQPGLYSASYYIFEKLHATLTYPALLASFILLLIYLFKKGGSLSGQPIVIIAATIVYVTLFHIPLASLPRFSIPFQPLIFIMFGYLLLQLNTIFRAQKIA